MRVIRSENILVKFVMSMASLLPTETAGEGAEAAEGEGEGEGGATMDEHNRTRQCSPIRVIHGQLICVSFPSHPDHSNPDMRS